MNKSLKDNQSGSTIMLVIISFFVIFIFTMGLSFVGMTNIKNTSNEEYRTKAYFVAKTGAEGFISHLKKSKDPIGELKKLAITSYFDKNTKIGKGEFFNKEFEIEVYESEGDSGETVFKIVSTGIVEGVRKSVTALLYPTSSGWGDGQIYVTGNLTIPYVPQLQGAGLKLYTTKKKDSTTIPIMFEQGDIGKLFKSENDRWGDFANTTKKSKSQLLKEGFSLDDQVYIALSEDKKKVGDYSLQVRKKDENSILQEHMRSKTGGESFELNYSFDPKDDIRFKEPVFPTYSFGSSEYKLSGAITNDRSFSEMKISANQVIDARKASSKILIATGLLEVQNTKTLTIITDKNKPIDIVVSNLKVLDNAKIDVEGDGVVNFYVAEAAEFVTKSRIGIKESIESEPKVNLYIKDGKQVNIQNGAQLRNVDTIGIGATLDLQDDIIYEGVIIAKKVMFKDKCSIKSPTTGHTSNTGGEGLFGITWE